MAENQVAFLYKAAYSLPSDQSNDKIKLLKSYYFSCLELSVKFCPLRECADYFFRMRCQQITNGFGLPEKQFSSKTRCPKCCIEWKNGSVVKLNTIKLSKKQRRRIRKLKPSKERDEKMDLLHSNQMEKTCLFCKNSTTVNIKKPESVKIPKKKILQHNRDLHVKKNKSKTEPTLKKNEKNKPVNNDSLKAKEVNLVKPKQEKIKNFSTGLNIYGTAKDVFSLKNKNNSLQSSVKETPKVIKNNKRKKDKFAGLCQKAVLASMKMKEEQDKKHKINLFLKPSG